MFPGPRAVAGEHLLAGIRVLTYPVLFDMVPPSWVPCKLMGREKKTTLSLVCYAANYSVMWNECLMLPRYAHDQC